MTEGFAIDEKLGLYRDSSARLNEALVMLRETDGQMELMWDDEEIGACKLAHAIDKVYAARLSIDVLLERREEIAERKWGDTKCE